MNFNLSADEKNRYCRQLSFKGFGETAQIKLKNATILVVGVVGLGCPALLYLVASGIGKSGIIYEGIVSASNLHR